MSLQDLWRKLTPFDVDQKIVLATTLSMQECLRRLSESMDEERTVSPFSWSGFPKGSKAATGVISGCEFPLRKRRAMRNDFAPWFFGILIPAGSGTEIVGHFDWDPWTKGFMQLWLVMVSFFALIALLGVLVGDKVEGVEVSNEPGLFLVPLLMVGVGIWGPRLLRTILHDQEEYLIDFLKQTLAADVQASRG